MNTFNAIYSCTINNYTIPPRNVVSSVTPTTSNDGSSYIYTFSNDGYITFNNYKNPTITTILVGGGGGGGVQI
jgi:hypothetical protein